MRRDGIHIPEQRIRQDKLLSGHLTIRDYHFHAKQNKKIKPKKDISKLLIICKQIINDKISPFFKLLEQTKTKPYLVIEIERPDNIKFHPSIPENIRRKTQVIILNQEETRNKALEQIREMDHYTLKRLIYQYRRNGFYVFIKEIIIY